MTIIPRTASTVSGTVLLLMVWDRAHLFGQFQLVVRNVYGNNICAQGRGDHDGRQAHASRIRARPTH